MILASRVDPLQQLLPVRQPYRAESLFVEAKGQGVQRRDVDPLRQARLAGDQPPQPDAQRAGQDLGKGRQQNAGVRVALRQLHRPVQGKHRFAGAGRVPLQKGASRTYGTGTGYARKRMSGRSAPTSRRLRSFLRHEIVDRCGRRIGLDRSDSAIASGFGGVGLTSAQDLAIAERHERKIPG